MKNEPGLKVMTSVSQIFFFCIRIEHTTEFFCLINRDLDANTAVIQGLILSFKCVNHKHGGCFTTFYIYSSNLEGESWFELIFFQELKLYETQEIIEYLSQKIILN